MKRYGNLFNKIVDIDNIKLAHKNASKRKKHYTEVKMVDSDINYYCELIQNMLINKTYTVSEYKIKYKKDKNKVRKLYILPYFPDRIIQHAIIQKTIACDCIGRTLLSSHSTGAVPDSSTSPRHRELPQPPDQADRSGRSRR